MAEVKEDSSKDFGRLNSLVQTSIHWEGVELFESTERQNNRTIMEDKVMRVLSTLVARLL